MKNAIRTEEFDEKRLSMTDNAHISKMKSFEPEIFEAILNRAKEWTLEADKKYIEIILYNKEKDYIASIWCTKKEYNDYHSKDISRHL